MKRQLRVPWRKHFKRHEELAGRGLCHERHFLNRDYEFDAHHGALRVLVSDGASVSTVEAARVVFERRCLRKPAGGASDDCGLRDISREAIAVLIFPWYA